MAFKWETFGKKTYKALKKYGTPAVIIITETDGDYDMETGQTKSSITNYNTHAIIKNFTTEDQIIVNEEDVEISFHSGVNPDTIPDLMDKGDIKIQVNGKIYKVINLKVIRPATVTMMYKARASESKDVS